ncbi:hypothetical protein SVIOM74S_01867 [Streptomyces violarus]
MSTSAEIRRAGAARSATNWPSASGIRDLRESRTPCAVRAMTCCRAAGSWTWWTSQVRSWATALAGRRPPPQADSGSSGTVNRGTCPSPALVSRAPYCRDTSATTWWGTRSRTVTRVTSYSLAVRSMCQGTASA